MEPTTHRRVVVITDSTADIPQQLLKEVDVHIAPQVLIMGDQTWRDGVDIDSHTFYELLQTSSHFPSTSQPSVTDFVELFVELSKHASGIVAVVVSDELSGTLNSAQMAAASLPDIPIEVVDSRAVSMQLGFTVLAAARAAAAGKSLQAVADAARALIGRVYIYFVVDTLEYLHRGGRIGAASRLIGSALSLKPLLEIKDGIVTPLARVRTRRKALDKALDLVQAQLSEGDIVHMAVMHINAPQEAESFRDELEARFHPVEMLEAECGPVIGAHAGPGTVAVAFYVE
jgi:DegV family protein with EDD domain